MSSDRAHPVDVGMRAEVTILAALVCRGYRVLEPYGFNHRYDLVIDHDSLFVRVQCKTGRLRDGRVLFNALSTRSNTRVAARTGYEGAADLFLIWCPDIDQIYCVGVPDGTRSVASLRVDPPKNRQRARVRWAKDHLIDRALPAALDALARDAVLAGSIQRGAPYTPADPSPP